MKKIFNILLTILFTCLLFHINTQKINAASASISVSSSTSQIVVGKEFTVTVKISSSTSLGSWEWVINYNSKNFKLLSGTSYVVDYASNGSVIYDSIVPNMLNGLSDVLIGVVIVLVLSASMSTLSSLVLASSSTLTLDFIKEKIATKMTEQKQYTCGPSASHREEYRRTQRS